MALSALAAEAMQRVPQVLENANFPKRRPVDEMAETSKTIRRIEGLLGESGRVLVRWSGTEAKLRIMLEGPDEDRLRKWAKDLASAAKKDVP